MLRHRFVTLMVMLGTIVLTGYLYVVIPKGFFPQQDTGLIIGLSEAAQDISYSAMAQRQQALIDAVLEDPAVASVGSAIGAGGGTTTVNNGRVFIALKPRDQRDVTADQVIRRLQTRLARIQGITLYMQAAQDITIGGRLSKTQYQYTLADADPGELNHWAPLFLDKIKAVPGITDVTTDQENAGPLLDITVNREVASSFGILPSTIDNTLDDAFGQRIVSTMYTPLNQYHVVLEVDPKFQFGPEALNDIYVNSSTGQQVPLRTLVKSVVRVAPLVVNHQGQFPSVTISFNLAPGTAIGQAVSAIQQVEKAARQAGLAGDELPGQRPGLPVIAVEHADPDRRGARRHLSHPRHALREHDPPDHHPLDLAVGRYRRAAAAHGVSLRLQRDRDGRHHPAHRHRQEKRHHADRFRARRRAQTRA